MANERLRSDGQVVPSSAAAALMLPQPLGQRKGALGLSAVGQEAAGLPAFPAGGDRALLLRFALGSERVLSESDVEQYAATARMRLRAAA